MATVLNITEAPSDRKIRRSSIPYNSVPLQEIAQAALIDALPEIGVTNVELLSAQNPGWHYQEMSLP